MSKNEGVGGAENRDAAGHNRNPIGHDYGDLVIIIIPRITNLFIAP
jgi:hypothetical protein